MDVLSVLEGRLEVVDDSVSSRELINRLVALGPREEPLHLVELDAVVKRHYDWVRHMPRVRPFYAIKSNDEPAIVETAALLGCGFDCASIAEVRRVLGFGVNRERIIFGQPMKTIEALQFAKEKKVRTVFDSDTELRKIHQYYPEAEVLIRFRFVPNNADANYNVKFGCNPATEARQLLDLAKELGITVIGWCFNVGAACSDPEILYRAIEAGRKITDYATDLGFSFRLIDLGGGFSGRKGIDVGIYATHINRALQEFFPEDEKWSVIAEPGRYYSAAAHTSVIPVHGKKVFRNEQNPAQIERVFYYFNDGIYGTFYSAKYRKMPVKPVIWKKREECGPERRSFLYGPSCDGIDCFAEDILLPELDISDFIIFEDQGAYSRVHSCRFNGFCVPKPVIFIRKSVWELLEQVASATQPERLVLDSKYLQLNYKLEAVVFE